MIGTSVEGALVSREWRAECAAKYPTMHRKSSPQRAVQSQVPEGSPWRHPGPGDESAWGMRVKESEMRPDVRWEVRRKRSAQGRKAKRTKRRFSDEVSLGSHMDQAAGGRWKWASELRRKVRI